MLATDQNMQFILEALQKADEIAVDTETSGLNVRNNVDYLTGVCVDAEGISAYIPFRHKVDNVGLQWVEPLVQALEEKDLIWHHRKFDMHSFKTLGVDPLRFKGKQWDTMLMFHLWNEEEYSFEMDYLAKKFLQDEKTGKDQIHEFGQRFGYENITPKAMEPYGCKDASLTRNLKRFVYPKLQEQQLIQIYLSTEMPFTALLYQLEQRGVGVDREFAAEKAKRGRSRMATITRELGFNPASPIALGKYLLDELKLPVFAHTAACLECKKGRHVNTHEGKPSFNKLAMQEYDDILSLSNNPNAKRITEYRGWQKATTSLYEPLLTRTGPDDFIRTEFKQHGTVTGRLSAREPNLQQVPRGGTNIWNGDAKSAFTSGRDGFSLIGWDYSQLELRLAAAYGQETVLLEEFTKQGADPFSVLAPLIFGILTPRTRQDTKTFVYANLYGAGKAKIALQLGRPLSEVEGLYDNFKASISGIMAVSSKVTRLVEQRKFVKYWDGRRRHIRRKRDAFKAWNSVCQGGGAQLVKRAMLRCQEFEDENCQMVLQVHDEITFVIRDDMIPIYEPKIIQAMVDWPDFGVHFEVEGKVWK